MPSQPGAEVQIGSVVATAPDHALPHKGALRCQRRLSHHAQPVVHVPVVQVDVLEILVGQLGEGDDEALNRGGSGELDPGPNVG